MMNKKEQALVQSLKDKYALWKALRWTEKVEPDVPIPASYSDLAVGYVGLGGSSDLQSRRPIENHTAACFAAEIFLCSRTIRTAISSQRAANTAFN